MLNGDAQALDSQRVLGSAIYVALAGPDGVCGNYRPLDYGVRVSLHNAAVHEGPRVALVSVADHVLIVTGGPATEVPFLRCGEAGPTSSPEPRSPHLVDHLIRRHLGEDLTQSVVTTGADVIVYPLGVDVAAFAQYETLLLPVEHDVVVPGYGFAAHRLAVEKPLDGPAFDQVRMNDFRDIFRCYVCIEGAFRFNDHYGALLAKTVAACEVNRYVIQACLCDSLLERSANLLRPG